MGGYRGSDPPYRTITQQPLDCKKNEQIDIFRSIDSKWFKTCAKKNMREIEYKLKSLDRFGVARKTCMTLDTARDGLCAELRGASF